jgi:hypothetical protein
VKFTLAPHLRFSTRLLYGTMSDFLHTRLKMTERLCSINLYRLHHMCIVCSSVMVDVGIVLTPNALVGYTRNTSKLVLARLRLVI